MLCGYNVVYAPDHPNSMKNAKWNGYIYEHIKIASEFYNVILAKGQVVHHIDLNKQNNDPHNLVILTKAEHTKIHMEMKVSGIVYTLSEQLKLLEINRDAYCSCGRLLSNRNGMLCTICSHKNKRKFEVSKEELESLIKEKPMTEIGKMFGVSDNAIKKRCKKLGIELKPMRGYWATNSNS